MKPRRLAVSPQAQRDLHAIMTWYRKELGAGAAAKAVRTIQAGIRAAASINLAQARRSDLPETYYRVVAKAHLVIFQVEGDTARIVRIVHGARDVAAVLRREQE